VLLALSRSACVCVCERGGTAGFLLMGGVHGADTIVDAARSRPWAPVCPCSPVTLPSRCAAPSAGIRRWRETEREREMRETDRHVRTEQRCAGPHAAPLGADRRVGVCTGGMHVRYS
jgi:hypothetical protein